MNLGYLVFPCSVEERVYLTDKSVVALLIEQRVFFNRTGLLAFLFVVFSETGRIIRGYTKGQKMMQVIVTDGFNEALTGTCIYFLKSTTDEITLKNVDKV